MKRSVLYPFIHLSSNHIFTNMGAWSFSQAAQDWGNTQDGTLVCHWAHLHTPSYSAGNIEKPNCKSLDYDRILEYLEKAHVMGIACKLHTDRKEVRFQSQTMEV